MGTTAVELVKSAALWACSATATAVIVSAPAYAGEPIIPTAGSGSASDAISTLEAQGFDVEVNWLQGHPNVPLNECRVNEIHDPNGAMANATGSGTIYVDIACPNAK